MCDCTFQIIYKLGVTLTRGAIWDAVEQAIVCGIVEYSILTRKECVWSQWDCLNYSSSRPFVVLRVSSILDNNKLWKQDGSWAVERRSLKPVFCNPGNWPDNVVE